MTGHPTKTPDKRSVLSPSSPGRKLERKVDGTLAVEATSARAEVTGCGAGTAGVAPRNVLYDADIVRGRYRLRRSSERGVGGRGHLIFNDPCRPHLIQWQ
jgi:hypothetical protein